jgi:hypothetical protein
MASKAQQIMGLHYGVPVIINIGLEGPKYAANRRLSQGAILGRSSVLLRDVLYPIRGEVYQQDSGSTLVAQGNLLDDCGEALWELCERSNQDGIAVWYPTLQQGTLFGPYAAEWGGFNPEFFVLPHALRAGGLPLN